MLNVRDRPVVTAAGVLAAWALAARLLPNGAPLALVGLGLVFGSIVALTALSLILVYRANRIVNFAHAAFGGVGGVIAVNLFLVLGWNYYLTLFLGVITGIVVAGLSEVLVVRRFTNSPRLILTVATIGLAQLLGGIELLIPGWFGSTAFVQAGFATPIDLSVNVGPVLFTGDHLLILLAVPFVGTGLAWFLLRTDAGAAVRAAAENTDRALLLGIPVRRLSTLVWMIAGGIAALTFVLKAPFGGAAPGGLLGPTLLLPALAAAVVARMESLPIAVVAGLGLGVLEQIVLWNTNAASLVDVVFLAVILVALLFQREHAGRASSAETWAPTRTRRRVPDELRRLPEVRGAALAAAVVVVGLALAVPALARPSTVNVMTVTVIWGIVAVSLVVLVGWGGHVSLGQFAIVGAAAIVAGNLMVKTGLDYFAVLLLAGVTGALVALLIGLPALRIRGPFLAVTTLAFAVALNSYFLNPTHFGGWIPQELRRPILWQRFDLEDGTVAYYLALGVLALALVAAWGIRRARGGRALVAGRDNPQAAEAVGIPTVTARLSGFLVSGALAGIAGALHVMVLHGARLGSYRPFQSIEVFSMAVIGGIGSLGGALTGVVGVRLLHDLADAYRLLVTGVGMLVILLVVPGGLGDALAAARDRLLRVVAHRRGISVFGETDGGEDERDGTDDGIPDTTGVSLADPDPSISVDRRAVLRCRGVNVSYGSLQVLFGVDLEVTEGETLALLGTNGAGKSTLLKTICGLLRPSAGTIALDGRDAGGCSPAALVHEGVALMPGGKGVFPTLSVHENLRLATWPVRRDRERCVAAIEGAFEMFPILRERANQRAGNLSGGEQQMLALAQSLMTGPRLLLVDELSLGLSPKIVEQLIGVVADLPSRGTTVVIVEQSVNVALRLAERAVFLEKGSVRFSGPTADLLDRPDILRSVFLGGADAGGNGGKESIRSRRPLRSRPTSSPAGPITDGIVHDLECHGVTKRFGGITAVDAVTLEIAPGRVVGLIGPNGAGKTTLLDCITGTQPPDGGRIVLEGHDVAGWPTHRRALLGLGRSFQDARLYPSLTVHETVAVARERHLASRAIFAAALGLPASTESELEVNAEVDHLVESLGLAGYRHAPVGELSTGTRRVVELACALAQNPKVLLLDEPSAGLAQREVEALAPLLIDVRERMDCSLLVVDHDMPLLSAMCDDLVAMETGAVVTRGSPQEVLDHPTVVASYLGGNEVAIQRSGRSGTRRRSTRRRARSRR